MSRLISTFRVMNHLRKNRELLEIYNRPESLYELSKNIHPNVNIQSAYNDTIKLSNKFTYHKVQSNGLHVSILFADPKFIKYASFFGIPLFK